MYKVFIVLSGLVLGSFILPPVVCAQGNDVHALVREETSPQIIRNDDGKNLPPCGKVAKGESCSFYILNETRFDKRGQDFFEETAAKMSVSVYHIHLANPRYSQKLIPPGCMAEIKIPIIH